MRDHQDAKPLAVDQTTYQFEQSHLMLQVERDCGLIEDQQARFLRQCARHAYALVLAARQRPEPTIGEMLGVTGREGAHDGAMIFRPLSAPQREVGIAAKQYGFAHALGKEVVFALRYHSHQPRQLLPRPASGGATVDAGVTFERCERPEREAHERRLPAPVWAAHSVN